MNFASRVLYISASSSICLAKPARSSTLSSLAALARTSFLFFEDIILKVYISLRIPIYEAIAEKSTQNANVKL